VLIPHHTALLAWEGSTCRVKSDRLLELLRFFLNHRPFLRSHKPERRGKTPTQLLTAQDHPHWLEMLGFQRFRRAVV
jgi:hypothetical protein